MILSPQIFKKLKNLLLEDKDRIDYILINYTYITTNNGVELLKEFIPIYKDLRYKRKSATKVGVKKEELIDVLSISLALVVYDRKRYDEVQNSNIEDIVIKVIQRSGSKERFNRIMEALKRNNINIKDYHGIRDNKHLIQTVSTTYTIQTIYDKVITAFSKLDNHFLNKEQIEKMTRESKEFNHDKYDELNIKKKKEYLENIYKNLNKSHFYFSTDIINNITSILNDNGVFDLLKSDFFDKDDYLTNINNIFTKKIVPTPSMLEKKQKIYELIYDNVINEKELKIHTTATSIYEEILNEVKFINLYTFDDSYGVELYKQSLENLYKRMGENKLTSVKTTYDVASYFVQKLHESSFYKSKMEDIEYEQMAMTMLEMETNYDGISDIDEYKKDYVSNKIKSDDFYIPYLKKHNIIDVDYTHVIDARKDWYKQVYKNDFLFNHYKLEKEFENTIVEEYFKTSKNTVVEAEPEESYITSLRDEIPTTRRVNGKPKKYTKKEVEEILQEKIAIYHKDQNYQKSQNAFHKKFDSEISTETEIESIVKDFYKKEEETKKQNSQDLFYEIMRLGLTD